MQEIKKKRIVIASVLKPVDDTRMFEKIGQSLTATNKSVHILGYPSKKKMNDAGVTSYPSRAFKRLSLRRIIQPLLVLRSVFKLSPDVLIITTHELLSVAVIIKLVTGCRLLYDVQENYYKNIIHTNAFPVWMRPFLASYVRIKELILSPFINHFILAEKNYANEMKFVATKHIVLENKLKKPATFYPKKSKTDSFIHLLFSGTLAESTGVFGSIALAKKLHAMEPTIRLTLIGFCSQDATLQAIKKEIEEFYFIELIGGTTLIPHNDIIREIQQSDFGIIAYPPNPSTQDRVPTKLYEYLGYKLPILLVRNSLWIQTCSNYSASILVDFDRPDGSSILHDMKSNNFYTTSPENVFWESDVPALINLIDQFS